MLIGISLVITFRDRPCHSVFRILEGKCQLNICSNVIHLYPSPKFMPLWQNSKPLLFYAFAGYVWTYNSSKRPIESHFLHRSHFLRRKTPCFSFHFTKEFSINSISNNSLSTETRLTYHHFIYISVAIQCLSEGFYVTSYNNKCKQRLMREKRMQWTRFTYHKASINF